MHSQGLALADTHTYTQSEAQTHTYTTLISWSWPVNGHTDTYNCTHGTYTPHITHYVYAAWHETSCCIVNYVLTAIPIRLSCR